MNDTAANSFKVCRGVRSIHSMIRRDHCIELRQHQLRSMAATPSSSSLTSAEETSSTPMRSAQALWDAAAPLISITEKHPFLVAMVDGTLPLENFRYYVVQDALYLADFATALRLVACHDGISAEESKRLNSFADGAEEAELCLHTGFFKKWGILDDATNGSAEQMPHTLLYTSYMLRVAATRPHAEGLAVLLPCFWVYMHVGQCMQKLRNDLGDRCVFPQRYSMATGCARDGWWLTGAFQNARSHNVLCFPSRPASSAPRSLTPGSTCTAATTLSGMSATTLRWWTTRRAARQQTILMTTSLGTPCNAISLRAASWSTCSGIKR